MIFVFLKSGRYNKDHIQDRIFFVRVCRLSARSVWVLYVAAQMTAEDCPRFRVKLVVAAAPGEGGGGGGGGGPSFEFSGPPCSLTASLEAVLKGGNCLLMTDPNVLKITGDSDGERKMAVRLDISEV